MTIKDARTRSNTHLITLTDDEQFFYDHAEYSWDSAKETAGSGRARNAVILAQAEHDLNDNQALTITWEIDPEAENEPDGNYTPTGAPQWRAFLWRDENFVLASVSGVDLGFDVHPDDYGYKAKPAGVRVVEAQLVIQAGIR